MRVVNSFGELATEGHAVGLVPTMGYLHEGHLSLIKRATECDSVVVSVFVNPLQFGADEDLDSYPRDLARDLELAEQAGADVVFAPSVTDMYSEPILTRVSIPSLSHQMEGRMRPGHFDGVATVVTKLLAGVRPQRAYFGRKDAQQLAVVRRLVSDLSFPVSIIGCPIIRDHDGLALSSRNRRLGSRERKAAPAIFTALRAAGKAVTGGERDARVLCQLVNDSLSSEPRLQTEYVELVDAANLQPLEQLDGPSFLAVAVKAGGVRLLDNIHFFVEGEMVDFGHVLSRPSVLGVG